MPDKESLTGIASSVATSVVQSVSTGTPFQRVSSFLAIFALTIVISSVALVYFTKDTIGTYLENQNKREERREAQENEFRRATMTSQGQFENVAHIVRQTDQELKSLKNSLKASRVIVTTFIEKRGNTDQYVFMNARQWEPIEAVDGGVRGIKNQHLSLFPLMVANFQQKKCLTIAKTSPTQESHSFWLSRGTSSVIACPIRNFNSPIFGALIAEYDAPFDEAEGYFLESQLNQSAFNLGGILFSQDAIQNSR